MIPQNTSTRKGVILPPFAIFWSAPALGSNYFILDLTTPPSRRHHTDKPDHHTSPEHHQVPFFVMALRDRQGRDICSNAFNVKLTSSMFDKDVSNETNESRTERFILINH